MGGKIRVFFEGLWIIRVIVWWIRDSVYCRRKNKWLSVVRVLNSRKAEMRVSNGNVGGEFYFDMMESYWEM